MNRENLDFLNDLLGQTVSASVLCWLATAGADGQPNVSPKEIFCADGENTLLIADIASPASVRNIAVNPRVCVSLIDVFAGRGAKVIGRARLIERDSGEFAERAGPILDLAGPDFPVRRLIVVDIQRLTPIFAPSYTLFPERSVAEQIDRGYERYGVRGL